MNELAFHETRFNVIDQDGQPWLQATEIAAALGYSDPRSITKIYYRYSDEFTPAMTLVPKLTTKGFGNGGSEKEIRIFSLRGAHLVVCSPALPAPKNSAGGFWISSTTTPADRSHQHNHPPPLPPSTCGPKCSAT